MANRAWRFFLTLCALLCLAGTANADANRTYDIDLPAQSVADALNHLSEQTGVPVIFSYDLARNREAHPVSGRYTLQQALDALLASTGLSGGLSEKGVLTISISGSNASKPGETSVTHSEKTDRNNSQPGRVNGIAAFFATIAAAFGANAHADEPSAVAPAGEDVEEVEEIVVSAQKKGNERLREVPIPITVVNTQQLAAEGQVRLRDFYATVPGITIAQGPGTGLKSGLTMRGIPPLGDVPTVAVVIDDTPYGSPVVYSAGHQVIPEIDPGELARIETLRGPQGTLYGASGMGGLVRFVTIEPSTYAFSSRLQVGTESIENGSGLGYSLRGGANIPVSDHFAVRASGFYRRDAGYIDNPVIGKEGLNEADTFGGNFAALWSLSDTVSLKFNSLYQDIEREGLNDITTRPGFSDLEQYGEFPLKPIEVKIQAHTATFQAKLDRADIVSITGYNRYAQLDRANSTALYSAATTTLFNNNLSAFAIDRLTEKLVQEVRLTTPVSTQSDLLLGAFYTHEDTDLKFLTQTVDLQGEPQDLFYDRRIPSNYTEYALFANYTYRFSDRFDVQLGGRHSIIRAAADETYVGPGVQSVLGRPSPVVRGHQKAEGTANTYLFSPRYRFSDDMMVYARFSSGYRPGNINLGISTADVAAGAPSEFRPDKTRNYEIGFKGDFFGGIVSLDASMFQVDWSDIQTRVVRNPAFPAYTVNVSEARSKGAELGLTLRATPLTTLSGWYAYNDAALTQNFPTDSPLFGRTGDRLPVGQKHSGFLSLRQEIPLVNQLRPYLGAQASFVDDRVGNFRGLSAGVPLPRQTFASYVQIDLRAGLRTDTWDANVYVNNLNDKRGVIGGGLDGFPSDSFAYITPRTIGLSLAKSFE